MPRRPPSVCTHPGCGVLVPLGRGPCGEHRLEARRASDSKRPTAAARGYTSKWAKASKQYRKSHPICEWPGCTAPSEATDHIDGQGPKGPRGFDPQNWQALCWPHHSAKTAEQTPGGWHGGDAA